jgi:hypothetical protein
MQNDVNDFFCPGVLSCVLFSAVMYISWMVSWLLMFLWPVCVACTCLDAHACTHSHQNTHNQNTSHEIKFSTNNRTQERTQDRQ